MLGAAEYRGRPSPVLRARLDHALELYDRKLAPRILTTGGAGGDPVFTEGGVGRSYLTSRGVPLDWRAVTLRWDDGIWWLDFKKNYTRPFFTPYPFGIFAY